jgi:hypothetical protein
MAYSLGDGARLADRTERGGVLIVRFIAVAVCCDGNTIEIGSGESYGDAERAVKRFAKYGSCEPVAYFRVEKRMYCNE